MRTDAISYLSKLPGDNAIATLQDLMRTSEDANIQRAAVRSLSRSDNARARQSIRALIERTDVSETLRAEALSSFDAERSNADDAAYLRSLYPRLAGERLRSAAISAMSRLGGDENERFVLAIARNQSESSETRAAAISRLARAQTVSIAEWQRLYDSAESRGIRQRIIQVYQQRTEPEAVDRLIEIIEKGTDPTLRSYAMNALRLKDDARAQKALQAIVDR
jgi:HEAT repeat protein